MHLNNKLVLLPGDASFRKFYRKKNSIIVFCEKEKKNNLLIYDAINKVLIKNKLKAPKLISENYKKNFIEIEDLGKTSFYIKLKKRKNSKINYYKKIILLLSKLQTIKTKKIKTFTNSNYIIPKYSKNKLFNESNLFLEWYVSKIIKGRNQRKIKNKLKIIIKKLIDKIMDNNNIFVHRDFHISNLMEYKKRIALIDSQDAVYGNRAYDLASLIDDVRFKTTIHEKKKIFNAYIKLNKGIDIIKFINDFEILSVLRNLKIIGIFTRLSIRDKKHTYLKLIPYAWSLIEFRINNNMKFLELKEVLDKYFSKKIRKKK